VAPGEQFTVELDAAIGSGHRWELRGSDSVDAQPPGDYFFSSPRPGSPLLRLIDTAQDPPLLVDAIQATQVFRLEGLAAGRTMVEFDYISPSNQVVATRAFSVEVRGLAERAVE
jgi:hypothetical protein